ncbi:hypothetical protein ACFGYU_01880 [Pasteurella multocida]
MSINLISRQHLVVTNLKLPLLFGTGYRFNERIAAKAGIAKSVEGAALSYNVGVNYEF